MAPPPLCPMVLLRHELPDGSWHFDWMFARRPRDDPGGSGALLTFRVSRRPDEAGTRALEAVRLPDHRVEYLSFEGDIAGGRGRVARVALGEARLAEQRGGSLAIESWFAGGVRRWVARAAPVAGEPDRWRFDALDSPS